MSIELCILASGSRGNCTAVRTPRGVMLIDAGLGPRLTAARLAGTDVALRGVSAICLTHLDCDHFSKTWIGTIVRQGIRIYCHWARVSHLCGLAQVAVTERVAEQFASLVHSFDSAAFEPIAGLKILPVALAHDDAGSHGFRLEGFGCRIGYATDLGRVPDALIELFEDLDLLALESNYDPQMQRESTRPWFLKRRIMGGRGHLSNQECFAAVRRILARHETNGASLPSHIVLLHRSGECNCPRRVREMFMRDTRIASRLVLAEQHERTAWLRPARLRPFVGEQLSLAWGTA